MHGRHPVRRARAVARRLAVVSMSIRRRITTGSPPECLLLLVLVWVRLLLMCVVLSGMLLVVLPGGSRPHGPSAPLALHATPGRPRMGRWAAAGVSHHPATPTSHRSIVVSCGVQVHSG